jgi:hypothetical protein
MAVVEQITLRISGSDARNGTNSAQALFHNRMIAGYRLSYSRVNSANRSRAAASVGAVYTGLGAVAMASQCCRPA